ncbi:MAG: hypothetical protein DRP78_03270 [Candidatus Omnitrophota bacterium]|nr:MAG: hypothetical protein DRP78_03270 [Candidatus Omnitrophota bacterium]
MAMNISEQKEFKHTGGLKKLIIANVLLALLVSLLNFFSGKQNLGVFWLITSIIWCSTYFMHIKSFFCKITTEGIIFIAPISRFTKRSDGAILEKLNTLVNIK